MAGTFALQLQQIRLNFVSDIKAVSVAIDGPAGAGKSTVSRLLSKKTGFELLDTGAMYRAFAWLDLQHHYGENLAKSIAHHNFDFNMETGSMQVCCDGVDISKDIRSAQVTSHVSKVAADPKVRIVAVELQRLFINQELRKGRSVILEGRDIGTVVLPNADIKFFLTADPIRRAERRAAEVGGDVQEIAKAISVRDQLDSSREASPLAQASDAILVDASDLDAEEVANLMFLEIEKLK